MSIQLLCGRGFHINRPGLTITSNAGEKPIGLLASGVDPREGREKPHDGEGVVDQDLSVCILRGYLGVVGTRLVLGKKEPVVLQIAIFSL